MDIRNRRPRRTDRELEKDILTATKKEIEEKGYAGLTVKGISKRAAIEPSVFYKRYKDLYCLLERYTREYDYWHGSLFASFETIPADQYENYVKDIFIFLIDFLRKDKSMQEFILWEMSQDNEITRNSSRLREENTQHITRALEDYFIKKGIRINVRVFFSILLSSIYFILSHKGTTTICNINFKNAEGQAALAETITELIRKILSPEEEKRLERIAIAKKMKEKGLDICTIVECTGLPAEVIDSLIPPSL